MTGALGGVAVRPDGSNINPAALALLKFMLPDGTYLIPTPRTVNKAKPFAQQGFSVFTEPCHFSENQFLTNVDYLARQNGKIAASFFLADDGQTVTFPGNGLNPSGNIPGFPSPSDSGFRVFSLAHTYTLRSNWLNEARFGYVRTRTRAEAQTPFTWSDVGVAEGEMSNNNELPSLNILGSVSLASGFPRTIAQNSFVFSDDLSFVHGAHVVRFGGSVTRLQDNIDIQGLGSFVVFRSWPDFLLGLSAAVLVIPRGAYSFGRMEVLDVVDGQQRLTTFQIFLAALRDLARTLGQNQTADLLGSLLLNPEGPQLHDRIERYKLYPTAYDRKLYCDLVDLDWDGLRKKYPDSFYKNGKVLESAELPLRAWGFLRTEAETFINTTNGETTAARLDALSAALLEDFQVIAITLDEHDDAQVIFETLNAGGEPARSYGPCSQRCLFTAPHVPVRMSKS